jgi:ketosteroid isomerase-like protein
VAAAPAVPVSVEPSREVLARQVEAAVEGWRQAWSSRDMVGYLAAYSESFVPADGTTREAWMSSRYRNVGGRDAIDVAVRDLKIESIDPVRARVSFVQDYVSGSYREMNRPKTLDLARSPEGRWRIIAEWQGKEKPQR